MPPSYNPGIIHKLAADLRTSTGEYTCDGRAESDIASRDGNIIWSGSTTIQKGTQRHE